MRRPASGPERKVMGCPIVDAVSTPSTLSASSIAANLLNGVRAKPRCHDAHHHPSWDIALPSSRLSRVNSELCDRLRLQFSRLSSSVQAHTSGAVIGASSRLRIPFINSQNSLHNLFIIISVFLLVTHTPKRVNRPAHRKFWHHPSTKEPQLARQHLAHGYRPPTVVRIVPRPLCPADRRRPRT